MKKTKNKNNTVEDQLVDYTDNILSKKNDDMPPPPLTSDPELRGLEQTVLRLKNAFHEDGLSEETIQRMRKNIVTQWQQKKNRESTSSWKNWLSAINPFKQKWYSQRSRQRISIVISLAVMILLMMISLPRLNGISLDQPATSGLSLSPVVLVVSGVLILLALVLIRRKR